MVGIIVDTILRNRALNIFSFIFGCVVTVVMLIFYFGKLGRDERGRGIFATSCLIAILALLVLLNIYTALYRIIISDVAIFMHTTQILYNMVVLIQIISTIILRRVR